MEEADEIIVHSLREAGKLFGVTPDTVRQWCLIGRLDGRQAAGTGSKPGTWTVRIPKDHPDLLANKGEGPPPTYYPKVEDSRDVELAAVKAERDRLLNEVEYLREQGQAWYQERDAYRTQTTEMMMRLLEMQEQKALPPPIDERPWWTYFWPWWRTSSS